MFWMCPGSEKHEEQDATSQADNLSWRSSKGIGLLTQTWEGWANMWNPQKKVEINLCMMQMQAKKHLNQALSHESLNLC